MMLPSPLVMLIRFAHPVNVVLFKLPAVLPINNWPSVYESYPVPPLTDCNIPEEAGKVFKVNQPGAPVAVVVNSAPIVALGANKFTAPASLP